MLTLMFLGGRGKLYENNTKLIGNLLKRKLILKTFSAAYIKKFGTG